MVYSGRTETLGGEASPDSGGYFNLPLLSPGLYRLHVEAAGFQPQDLEEVELAVAGRLDFTFLLRPLTDVWEAGQYRSVVFPGSDAAVTFYGPDVDTSRSGSFEATHGIAAALDSSLSTVIDRQLISNLPLNGHDVYTLLSTQPGVTADTTVARGLGLAISGRRPSASNFLLDGLENNNYVVSGPLFQLAPEAIEEYRISTDNYSAEYGRTAGFVANAITKSAGTRWHGLAYDYQKSDVLNANGFQENAAQPGISRAPLKETEPGFFLGGPVVANRLFVSAALEVDRYRSKQDPGTITIPTTAFLQQTASNSTARSLLQQYAPTAVTNGILPFADIVVRPPVVTNRLLAAPRVDYQQSNGTHRILFRPTVVRVIQPDFGWTPYPDFVTPLVSNTLGLGAGWMWSVSPHVTNEARIGFSTDETYFNRPHPEVPVLAAGDGTVLPGSPLPYSYRNHGRNIELVENQIRTLGRHVFKFGGGLLARHIDGYVTAGEDGYFGFASGGDFANDQPVAFYIGRPRQQPSANVTPDYRRDYRYTQYFGFVQDSVKLTSRMAVNFGLRYENFGAPVNTGSAKDAQVQLGPGATLERRIAAAQVVYPGPGSEPLYDKDNRDIAIRAGFSYRLRQNSSTVMRGGFGAFFDRPFDNLWATAQANGLVSGSPLGNKPIPFLLPVAKTAAAVTFQFDPNFPQLTFFQPELRNAYVENMFWGIEQRIAEHFVAEVNGVGSFGRKLVTTDLVNRPLSVPPSVPGNPQGQSNAHLPMLAYRANQGISDYYGVQLVTRYRSSRLQLQASYTLSHTIDNQSEPLAGDFFNFSFNGTVQPSAAFTRQFDSRGDRSNSDFDQRHNLVAYAVWELPGAFASTQAGRFFRDWTLGGLAAFRSGFPYSPLTATTFDPNGATYLNNRADLVSPAQAIVNTPAAGGVQILNPAAFAAPAPGQLGNIGRNAFRGPGLYSADLSLSRRIRVSKLGEAGRVTLRVDAFNLLNHANLNNPSTILGTPPPNAFGLALYGRQGFDTGFPASAPLNETARQIQLMVRLEF